RSAMLKPVERLVDDGAARPFIGWTSTRAAGHSIAVRLESLDQPESAIQGKGGDESSCVESRARECIGQRRNSEVEPQAVVTGAMPGRIPPGHQARVRRQGDGRRGEGARE